MEKDKYVQTQLSILNIAKIASQLDLDGFLKQISSTETLAPMIDPTLYMKAHDNLQAVKKLAESLLPVKKAYQNTFDAVMRTAARGHMMNSGENGQ